MDPRISFITLAVPDLRAVRRFYVQGLGWPVAFEADEVVMIMCGEHLVLSLWSADAFEAEVGDVNAGPGVPPVTLAHNVSTPADVDAVLDDARQAGADDVRPGVRRHWGGYSGYFADPAGFRWEVAWNPGPIGQAVLP